MQSSTNSGFPIFFGIWFVLGVVSWAFFSLNKNAALKRKVFRPFAIGSGLLFLGFIWSRGESSKPFFWLIVAALVVIVYLNLKAVKFCDACGKTVTSQNPLSPAEFCPQCGSHLES